MTPIDFDNLKTAADLPCWPILRAYQVKDGQKHCVASRLGYVHDNMKDGKCFIAKKDYEELVLELDRKADVEYTFEFFDTLRGSKDEIPVAPTGKFSGDRYVMFAPAAAGVDAKSAKSAKPAARSKASR